MDKRTTGIVAYITLIGTIVALVAGDKEGAKFHINQALVIFIGSFVVGLICRFIPVVGGIISLVYSIFTLVCWIMGLVGAINDQEKEVPLLGKIKILK